MLSRESGKTQLYMLITQSQVIKLWPILFHITTHYVPRFPYLKWVQLIVPIAWGQL